MTQGKYITGMRLKRILDMITDGYTLTDIAEAIGTSEPVICSIAKRHKLKVVRGRPRQRAKPWCDIH